MPATPPAVVAMVKESLAASDLSQSALATAIGVTDSTISRLLTGGIVDVKVVVGVSDYFRWSQDKRRLALDLFATGTPASDR